ncbi:hypothetical protein [Pseudomonas sp. NPDC087336]|uniref:hypothetical protein n=1 Tax=Pseudomonas sp. NPDC087336 TaxID=3364436 RepID=UPI0037FF369E
MNTLRYDYRKISTFDNLESDIRALLAFNKAEKKFITESLEEYVNNLPDANAEFKLSNLLIPTTPDSSLELAHRAGQAKFNELLKSDEFLSLEELSSLPERTTYVCNSNKELHIIVDGTPMHIDDLLKENETLNQHLDELSEYANNAGGFIYSCDQINVEQWIRFYGHPMPSTAQQLANLMDFFKKERPALSGTGKYYDILKDPEISPTALTLVQREKIKNTTTTFGLSDTGQLLNRLVEQNTYSQVDLKNDPAQFINDFMEGMIGSNLAQDCLEALEWYGTDSDDSPCHEDLRQLLMAAIVVNIDPNIGEIESKGRVLGYALYQPANADLHPAQILLNLEKHIVANGIIDAKAAPLAVHILVADEAPEYLVKEIPESMTISSPAWVVHSFAVAKIETIAPGSSRAMTYEQVQCYADLGPFDQQLEQLFGLDIITHMLNWGAVNGLIPYSPEGEYTTDNFYTTETHYNQYTEALEQCSNAFNTPLPTREEVALTELKRAIPDGGYFTNKHFGHTELPRNKAISIHELYMSGDLMHQGWTGTDISANIYTLGYNDGMPWASPHVYKLRNVQVLYAHLFSDYYEKIQQGTVTALKLALSKMPETDRIRLEYGVLSFYTVREKFSDHATKETQRLRDKYRGRYGVIICAEHDAQKYYYELFTLRAECFSRQDLGDIFLTTSIEYFDPSLWADKDQMQWQAQALDWPLDIDAYLKGTAPVRGVTHKLVVEKLWQSNEAPPGSPSTRSQLETFFSQRTNKTVRTLLEHFPPATYEELYDTGYGVAPLEAARQNTKENIDLVLNLIIPFKGCIEDLTSGDPDREASGVVGCALDALAVVGAAAGVASKFASVALKSGSLLSKSVKLVRLSGSFALSLVNPLDNVSSLMKKGGNLTKNGVLLITGQGVNTSEKATRQIRSISGTLDALNAVKSLNIADVKIARLEGIGELFQATDVLICKQANDWYQLSLNSNLARGGKITNYKEISGIIQLA